MWTQVAQVREGGGPWVCNAAASLEAVWQRLDAQLWGDVSTNPAAPVLTCYITAVHSSTLTIILLTILLARLQTQTAHLRGPASPSAPNHGAECRLYMLPHPPKKRLQPSLVHILNTGGFQCHCHRGYLPGIGQSGHRWVFPGHLPPQT